MRLISPHPRALKAEILPKLFGKIILLSIALSVAFLILSLRLGGVVPEDFVHSQLDPEKLNFEDWKIYGHQEWAHLSYKMIEGGNSYGAEYAAKKAFAIDPGYGIAAGLLGEIYLKNHRFAEAKKMEQLSAQLWPARHYFLFKKNKTPP